MWKKHCALLLSIIMIISGLWPAVTHASETPDVPIKLEQAIRIARAAFPKLDLDDADFTSSFTLSENTPSWQLMWYDQDKNEVRITVNAENGRILQYNLWQRTEQTNLAPLPKLPEAEALAKAEAFLKELVPEEFANCRYQAGEPLRPYLRERNWHLSYNFRFQRYANDIPFNYNGLQVTVNADTGDITSYNYIWTEGSIPEPKQLIGADKAAAIAQEAGKMELQYYLPYADRGETPKPILVYQAPKINYIAVNALTGEIYTQPTYVYGADMDEAAKNAAAPGELSPAEQKEVTLLEGMLTQEQAEAKAREIFAIADDFTVRDARLTADWRYPEQRHWTLSFENASDPQDRIYTSVTLNAKSGEIYRYYTSMPRENYDAKGTLTRDEAEKLASAYLAKMNPDKAKQVELVTPEPTVNPRQDQPEENQLSYYFSYRRLVNGVPFPQNGFEVAVYAGKEPTVTSYNLNWVETAFPSKLGSLSLEQAQAKLRQAYPFHLEYRVPERGVRPLPVERAVTSTAEVKNPITLVYTQAPVKSAMFSAKDVQPLDYRGEPIKDEAIIVPTDIAGHPAKEDIAYLAKVGILPASANNRYQPSKAATVGDWLELLANATGNTVEQQIENLSRGKAIDQSSPLTREELALYAIRALGYEKIAAMSNIFRVPAADAAKVRKEYTGHVAIALELALLELQEDNFAPQAKVERGDLAVTLVQMLRLER